MNKEQVISSMCMTMRHDYGLDRQPDEVLCAGMTDKERDSLRQSMTDLYNHHVSPYAINAERAERLQCAEICLKAARGQGDIDRNSAAYQAYLMIMARDPSVSALITAGKSVEEAVIEIMRQAA